MVHFSLINEAFSIIGYLLDTGGLSGRGSLDDDLEDEVWMFCIDESWYFGLPLFKSRALREERSEERQGALPPTIAGAMAFSSVPRPDDVVLDPCCGSGTLLAEFHSYSRSAKLAGRDIDPRAVEVARLNLSSLSGASHDDFDISQADSRIGTAPEGLTLTLANLPFGLQFGDRQSNPALYRDLIEESLKAASNDWRGLFLTSDTESFAQALRELPLSTPEVMFKVKIRGEHATCFRLKKI